MVFLKAFMALFMEYWLARRLFSLGQLLMEVDKYVKAKNGRGKLFSEKT